MSKRGVFVVVDGLDGVGKGVFLDTFVEEAKKEGKRVFDVNEFWKEYDYYPSLKEIIGNFDVIVTSEPTFVGIGKVVRNEIIANNGREYTARATAEAYALDRRILYETLILPCLEAGIDVYQSRSFSTSIVFQAQQASDQGEKLTVEDILAISGNNFCYNHPMNHLIIPTIRDVEEAVKRSQDRKKQDDCVFENLEFQLKIKSHYESEELKELFEQKGVKVTYFDAGVSLEFSREQARDFYQQNLK